MESNISTDNSMELSNGSPINGNVKCKVKNKLKSLESSLELHLEDYKIDGNNDITKRVLRQSTMSQSYAKKSNTKVLPTPEEIASRDSRKRHKRTTPKKSIPTTTKQPSRIKSRSRFDDKPTTTNHNRSKSIGATPKNKTKPSSGDTKSIPKTDKPARRGRKPVKKSTK